MTSSEAEIGGGVRADVDRKITPNLWFDDDAEEAANFYVSVFRDSTLGDVDHYDAAAAEASGQPEGSVLTVSFEMAGQDFLALNGGPAFEFTPAISFIVNLTSADEVDELWARLSEGGEELMPLESYPFSDRYGWIEDRFGVSWQVMLTEATPEQTIVPSLLFTGDVYGRAEDAIQFYTSVFDDSDVGEIARYGPDQEPDEEGAVQYADFRLDGQQFAAMDSAHGHDFTFTEAISLIVDCEDQAEVDYFWEELAASGGQPGQCGWLEDQFGVSWQVVPTVLPELLQDEDPEKAERVMEAMLRMEKIDIATLQEAYAGA